MKNLVVEKLNNFIDAEIEKICNEYEQKIKELEEQNEELSHKLEQCRQQLLLIESNNIQKAAYNQVSEISKQEIPVPKEAIINDISKGFIETISMDTLSLKSFIHLIEQFNTILYESNDENTVNAVLNKYVDINAKKKQIHIKKTLVADDNKLTKHLTTSPICNIEKLQLFSKFKLTTHAKQYIENLLKVHVSLLKDTLSSEQLAHLFWYAFLYDYQSLFLTNFKNVATNENPLTSIYYKRIKQKDEKIFSKELRTILNNFNVFNNTDCDIIKSKLVRKNAIISSGLTEQKQKQLAFPVINNIYVIKEIDKSTFIQNFSLKRATILINLVDSSNNKSQKTIEAFVDAKQTKAYMTDKQYSAYLNQFSPFRPKISDYYHNFKWPSTEILNSLTVEATPLKKVSDLQAMGYQYNLKSNKRWAILCNAVNTLGLKKVVYTLASNTKRLKGRKPNSPAISIWESDLARLKRKFYTNGFQWPSTKI
ncbi:MAG: hypothetical protein ABS949_09385 [Solibacillus sp.]